MKYSLFHIFMPDMEREKFVLSSTAREEAKNVIKIDILLTKPEITEVATL